ncbi:hypothetical protein FJZ23_03400 [Candidatus Parcubacteria bacterium]|nr:hypothetical protein [Candidatus Parcubacteria bacterium]
MLDTRKQTLLQLIVEDYIQSAEPVGSKQLLQRHRLDVSSATIRNEMAVLEQEGYLRQPHTSAGRVPTEQAYLYYLQQVMQPTRDRRRLDWEEPDDDGESVGTALRRLAKRLVEISGETAILAMEPNVGYYAGVSNLFAKPDFSDVEMMRALSATVDQFDEVVAQVYPLVSEQTVVYVGSHNPFGGEMATVIVKYHAGDLAEGLLGLIGPLRMDYRRNIALVEQAKEAITQLYG